ncbi:hypothetical protein [Undibacterium fentianense]|uniref:Uncharacterized protein n=1 Tax=Undibacterium fentianense TaxID=2828728 RepID=A0A941IFR9_9BURK|nr:hypothetical protein [Undibacterium fentianense]MBR7800642.1 hypothetical protein [Undibacterium fentianense]
MSFVNEVIAEEDLEKYAILEIDHRLHMCHYERWWIRDAQRDIYLRWIDTDWEHPNKNYFMFYWKGTLFHVALSRDNRVTLLGESETTWKAWSFSSKDYLQIPIELEPYREEVTRDLKEALTTFKDLGRYSVVRKHTAVMRF